MSWACTDHKHVWYIRLKGTHWCQSFAIASNRVISVKQSFCFISEVTVSYNKLKSFRNHELPQDSYVPQNKCEKNKYFILLCPFQPWETVFKISSSFLPSPTFLPPSLCPTYSSISSLQFFGCYLYEVWKENCCWCSEMEISPWTAMLIGGTSLGHWNWAEKEM